MVVKSNEYLNRETNGKMVLVISGGEAFNYYVKNQEQRLKTHDYDLKLTYTEKFSSFNFKTDPSLRENLHSMMHFIAKQFLKVFNDPKNNSYYLDLLRHEGINLIPRNGRYFYPTYGSVIQKEDYFTQNKNNSQYNFDLRSISYAWNEGDNRKEEGLIDIVSYYFPQYYGDPNIDEDGYPYDNLSRYNSVYRDVTYSGLNFESRMGIIRNMLAGSYDEHFSISNLYYTSLGFLMWDTVQMMNWSVDYFNVQNNAGKNPVGKLERYTQKYIALLEALSHPTMFLKCGPFKDFCNKCSNEDENFISQRNMDLSE